MEEGQERERGDKEGKKINAKERKKGEESGEKRIAKT